MTLPTSYTHLQVPVKHTPPTPIILFSLLHLSLGLESLWEPPHIALDRALVPQKLHVRPVDLDLALGAFLEVLFAAERREAPILGDDDLLPAGKLVLGAAESFDGGSAVCRGEHQLSVDIFKAGGDGRCSGERTIVTGSDGEKDLANGDASDGAVGFAPRSTHPRLQPVGAGAGQHLVDADDMVGVSSHAEMEPFFAGEFHEVSSQTEGHQFLTS